MLAPLLLLGCAGETAEPDSAGDGWPVGSPVDTVLAYAAGSPDGLRLAPLFENQLGWRPAGLDGERLAVVVFLDDSVMGGPLGLALPVADPVALRDSLEACPGVQFTDDKRFVLTLPSDSDLINAMRAVRGLMNTGSLTELMAAIGQPVSTASDWQLTFREGQALIVPSFEAAFVMGKLLDELPLESVVSQAGRPDSSVVLSVDLERLRLTYYEELEQFTRQLDALLSGDPDAGPVGALGRLISERGGGDSPLGNLPVDGPTVLALIEMLSVDLIGAFQLQAHGLLSVGQLYDGDVGILPNFGQRRLVYRQRWTETSALSELLQSLRPVPAQEQSGQRALLSADPDAFPQALAAWLRPLVEVVHGPGEVSDERLDDLTELLSPWDGLLMVGESDGAPLGVATLQSGQRLNTTRLLAWFRPLIAAFEGGQRSDGAGEGDESADGERRGDDGASTAIGVLMVEEDAELPLSTWSLDDLLVIGTGEEDPLEVEALLDSARSLRALDTPAAGPWLELLIDGGQLSVETVGDSLEIVLGSAPVAAAQESR